MNEATIPDVLRICESCRELVSGECEDCAAYRLRTALIEEGYHLRRTADFYGSLPRVDALDPDRIFRSGIMRPGIWRTSRAALVFLLALASCWIVVVTCAVLLWQLPAWIVSLFR